MDDYQLGVIKFDNNHASLKLMSAINEMELDRLSGWHAYFKADYEREELKKENERLSKLVEELLCKMSCKKSRRK